MKSLVYDTGPIISMTTNNLLWVLDYLKEQFNGDFYIPRAVQEELVDKPLRSKKFKFEALQVGFRIRKGVLNVVETPQISALAEEILRLSNHIFKARGNWLHIVHYAEMEALAAAIILNASAVVVDERTARLLVEDPNHLASILGRKMGVKIRVDKKNLEALHGWTKHVKVLRSAELVMVAFEKGILDKYLIDGDVARRTLVESLLWGVKLRGCSLSKKEIDRIVEMESHVTG
ncbi:hypothetical protein HQ545_08885 [Candidatus Woesearchaeota archaeon]|nr:hypothetical protein [Candidatus Woesearchaeota archaeon]